MGFKVLVRNPSSALAVLLVREFDDLPCELVCSGAEELVWSSAAATLSHIDALSPNVVINLLPDSLSDVDVHRELSIASALVDACLSKNIAIIQLSSYRVFGDGYREQGFSEQDTPEPDPTDSVGRFFVQLERTVASHSRHLILRLPWLLDLGEESLLERTVVQVVTGKSLKVSSYYHGSGVPKELVCHVLTAVVQQILCDARNWGVFHLHSADSFSEAEFVDALLRLLGPELHRELATPEVIAEKDEGRLMEGCSKITGSRLSYCFGVQLPSWRLGFKRAAKVWLKERGYKVQTVANK